MYTGMADDLTSGVHQVAVAQLVDLLVQIAQCFGCCIKGILSFRHGECAGVGGLSVELNAVVEHSQHTVHHADVIACILQNRSLLDMRLEHVFISVR